jgi:hypothetical protein
MRSNITDQQQSSIITIVAKIPVEAARKPFLAELEKQLPNTGKVTDARLLAAINAALASFPPGQWQGDEQGFFPSDTAQLTLVEHGQLYQRMLRLPTVYWPPSPPPTPEQSKKRTATEAKPMSREEAAEVYGQHIYGEHWEQHKRDEAKRRAEELHHDTTPWPIAEPPPTTRTIRAEVNKDEPEAKTSRSRSQRPPWPI